MRLFGAVLVLATFLFGVGRYCISPSGPSQGDSDKIIQASPRVISHEDTHPGRSPVNTPPATPDASSGLQEQARTRLRVLGPDGLPLQCYAIRQEGTTVQTITVSDGEWPISKGLLQSTASMAIVPLPLAIGETKHFSAGELAKAPSKEGVITVKIEPYPTGTTMIRGRVVSAAGDPVGDAQVDYFIMSSGLLGHSSRTFCDSNGAFVIVDSRQYRREFYAQICASKMSIGVSEGMHILRQPNADVDLSQPLVLQYHKIRFRIVDQDSNQPVAGVKLQGSFKHIWEQEFTSDARGVILANAPSTTSWFFAGKFRALPFSHSVKLNGNSRLIRVRPSGGRLHVCVVDTAGKPIPGAFVAMCVGFGVSDLWSRRTGGDGTVIIDAHFAIGTPISVVARRSMYSGSSELITVKSQESDSHLSVTVHEASPCLVSFKVTGFKPRGRVYVEAKSLNGDLLFRDYASLSKTTKLFTLPLSDIALTARCDNGRSAPLLIRSGALPRELVFDMHACEPVLVKIEGFQEDLAVEGTFLRCKTEGVVKCCKIEQGNRALWMLNEMPSRIDLVTMNGLVIQTWRRSQNSKSGDIHLNSSDPAF